MKEMYAGLALVRVAVRPDPHHVVGEALGERIPVVVGQRQQVPLDDASFHAGKRTHPGAPMSGRARVTFRPN